MTMIQTQLLMCDKPYQIISAAGMVGIQVATLIVTEDKVDENGNYLIDTHSHPVVNYGSKEGLAEALRYYEGNPDTDYRYMRRLQPEGAVWNRVEVRDVYVLGLEGAKNIPIDLEAFIGLVPSLNDEPMEHLWDRTTGTTIYQLRNGLESLGLTFLSNAGVWGDGYFNEEIHLSVDEVAPYEPNVVVMLREAVSYYPPASPIFFKFRLSGDVYGDAGTLSGLLKLLSSIFDLNPGIKFVCDNTDSADLPGERYEQVKQLTEQMNEMWEGKKGA